MGTAVSPDIFHDKMNCMHVPTLMTYLSSPKGERPQDHVETEVDRDNDFHDHLSKLKVVLDKLQDKGLQVNVRKSNFAAEEIDYLGYVIS